MFEDKNEKLILFKKSKFVLKNGILLRIESIKNKMSFMFFNVCNPEIKTLNDTTIV